MIKEINFLAANGKVFEEDVRELLFKMAREHKWCSICAYAESKYNGKMFTWYCGGKEIYCDGTCPKWEEE